MLCWAEKNFNQKLLGERSRGEPLPNNEYRSVSILLKAKSLISLYVALIKM